jgi:MscS family membrane protein
MARHLATCALLILLAIAIGTDRASAQLPSGLAPAPTQDAEAAAPQVDPELQKLQQMLRTPEQTMRNFRKAVEEKNLEDAAKALDLSKGGTGPELAPRLKAVIDRIWPQVAQDVGMLPDEPDAEGPVKLETYTNLVQADDIRDAEKIEFVKGEDGLWRFSTSTVASIGNLYDRWADRTLPGGAVATPEEVVKTASMRLQDWLKGIFPESLQATHFLLPDYQWICVFIVLFVGLFADRLVRAILWYLTGAWVKYVARQKELFSQKFERKLWRPVGLLVQALIWFAGFRLLLPTWPPWVETAILVGLQIFAIVAAVWTAFIFINLFSAFLARKAAKTPTKFDDLLVPLVSKSLKIVAASVGVVSGAQVFHLPLAGVLTGLGIGGIALGLAAQDTIKNFFGSVMIFTDRPFELGDRIVIDGHDGPVEMVGFRSTRIRTLEGNLVTIPNGELANKTILNIGKRPNIRQTLDVTITYDTPREKVHQAVEIVREILADHEGMDPEMPPRVYFNRFNADSLNIWAIYWYHPPDWWAFCELNQRINFEILRRFEEAGIEFAFPTQTLYLAGDPKRPLPPLTDGADVAHNGEPARVKR